MNAGAIAEFLGPGASKRVLLALAAPAEARAALQARGAPETLAERPWERHPIGGALDLVVTGVSKANAAGAVARVLDPGTHAAVIASGVAGALPGSALALGDVVLADRSLFADEGLQTPAGFEDCASMGFPLFAPDAPVPPAAGLRRALEPLSDARGDIATVSVCSGTDARAREIRERTGAAAEAMEGAAVALVAARLGIPFAEVRVISNTTGDRPKQAWDLPLALRVLGRLIGRL